MNRRMILYILGIIMLLEAAFLLLPTLVAVFYGESAGWYFFLTAVGAAILGYGMKKLARPMRSTIYAREGLVCVALCWVELSLVGALPFTLCGDIPSYLNAVFETVSGFTTTGSSILTEIESLNHCSLFWRSFSHWLGGMGILVFMLAIVSMEGGQAIHLLKAESPGPNVSKMVPRMLDSSKIVYSIYFALTFILVILYMLDGISLFESLCHAFGTAGTGGFSTRSASLGAFSQYAQTVTTVFMLLFGVNFSIYFFLLRRKFALAVKNDELRWYLTIVFVSIALISINIRSIFPSLGETIHHAAFAVSSIITTTGYCTVDFDLWPQFSKTILVLLMLVGACAGSTGGGIKVSRAVLLFKAMSRELRMLIHPHSVKTVTMDGKRVGDEALRSVSTYFIFYAVVIMLSVLLVSLDGFDTSTTLTSVLATINNIGPGTSLVGPVGNYSFFSPLSKIVLILDMLFGRLELYPMLMLMLPSTWLKH